MPQTIQRYEVPSKSISRKRPPQAGSTAGKPFTLDQELKPFGSWVGSPIWVPPKDSSKAMAQTILSKHSPFASKDLRWTTVVDEHRGEFTQVREIDLATASIRLPQGTFFVEVTEQKDFDKITDVIPACVQTRLDEFQSGPGKQPGVKISYLKPLCVEVGNELILTSRADLMAAITKIQDEVFAEYRRLYLRGLPRRAAAHLINLGLAIPKGVMSYYVKHRQKAVDAYQAKLEFRRRKIALKAAKHHRKCFTNGCTFDEMLGLTRPLERSAVIEHYGIERGLSRAERDRLIRMAAGTLPWFVTLYISTAYLVSLSVTAASPVVVCDPAFVAEMPGQPGVLLKIGHFDEVDGVTHIEI